MRNVLIFLAVFIVGSASGWHTDDRLLSPIGSCPGHPCQNGGRCRSTIDPYSRKLSTTCRCSPPFAGQFCELQLDSACNSLDCGPGTCCLIKNRLDSATCICPPGLTGPKCGNIAPLCAIDRCNDRGDCVKGPEGVHCVCLPGFSGPNCEIDIDECQSMNVTCPSGKHCLDQLGGYSCVCPEGLVGENCEYANPCMDKTNSCGHGTCFPTWEGEAICDCMPGWTGEHCLDDVDECDFDTYNPCNDNEICFNTPGNYTCVNVTSKHADKRLNLNAASRDLDKHSNVDAACDNSDEVLKFKVAIKSYLDDPTLAILWLAAAFVLGLFYGYFDVVEDVQAHV
uniref:EGF-like domain-containing protein n=1 Tax=Panagrellus redivivus TaxID=6233 RepID=A0A7E4VDW7_PANRE